MVRERQRLWPRIREAWFVGLAVVVVIGWLLYRKRLQRRVLDKLRTAAVIDSLGATYDKVERAEIERNKLLASANKEAEKVWSLHERAEQTAKRLADGGHQDVAELIRRWNRIPA